MIDLQPQRCLAWLTACFGGPTDPEERALRLGEETNELMQAEGITREQAHALVDQVFDKPVGDPEQELGGVMLTLAGYCAVTGRDPQRAYETEAARTEQPEIMAKVRAKHQGKLVVSSKRRA